MLSREARRKQMNYYYPAYKTLIDTILEDLSEQDLQHLPEPNEPCLNNFIRRASQNIVDYGEALAEVVSSSFRGDRVY